MPTYGKQVGSGGGGGSAFGADALFRNDFANLLGAGLINEDYYNPLVDAATYDVSLGSNPFAVDKTYTGGVLTGPHGGNSSAYMWPKNCVPNTGNPMIANPSAKPWGVGAVLYFALTPPSNCEVDIVLSSNVDDIVVMRLLGSTSQTVFHLISDGSVSGSGRSDFTCTSVATIGGGLAVGTTIFYRLFVGYDPASGLLVCAVNGTLAGSGTPGGNMPTKAMSPAVILSGLADMIKVQSLWCGYQV